MRLICVSVQAETALMTAKRADTVFRFDTVCAAGFGAKTSNVSVNVRDGARVKFGEVVLHGYYQTVYRIQSIRSAAPSHKMTIQWNRKEETTLAKHPL